MDAKKSDPKKLSMSSTKQEMLDAYNVVLKELKEKEEVELRPEKKLEEKKKVEILKVADSVSALSVDGIAKEIAGLRADVAKTLGQISDNVEGEADKFRKVTQAVQLKEGELQELYAIEKEAVTLAALVEAQQRKRQEFDSRMAQDKEDAQREMKSRGASGRVTRRLVRLRRKSGMRLKRRGASAKRRSLNTPLSVSKGLRRRRFRTKRPSSNEK